MLSYLVNVACLLVGINLFIALPISAVSDEEPTPIGFLKTEASIFLLSLSLAALAA